MRKILGQAALTDKELAKRKAKEEEDDANIEAEGAPPGPGSPDSPDSPDFPLDPAGKIDLSKVRLNLKILSAIVYSKKKGVFVTWNTVDVSSTVIP